MKRIAVPVFVAALVLLGCSDDKPPTATASASDASSLPQPTSSADQAIVQRLKDQLQVITDKASGAHSRILDIGFRDGKIVVKTDFDKTNNDGLAATQFCVDAHLLVGSEFDLEILSKDGTLIAATRDKNICGPRV
jgi:hypothetical protein